MSASGFIVIPRGGNCLAQYFHSCCEGMKFAACITADIQTRLASSWSIPDTQCPRLAHCWRTCLCTVMEAALAAVIPRPLLDNPSHSSPKTVTVNQDGLQQRNLCTTADMTPPQCTKPTNSAIITMAVIKLDSHCNYSICGSLLVDGWTL